MRTWMAMEVKKERIKSKNNTQKLMEGPIVVRTRDPAICNRMLYH